MAPDAYSGTQEDWRTWSIKFRSWAGAMNKGTVGVWMDHARENRQGDLRVVTLNPEARAPAATLYSALIALCGGKAFVIAERSGNGEGIEAWRRLLHRYESQTCQSKVMKMIGVLQREFKSGPT